MKYCTITLLLIFLFPAVMLSDVLPMDTHVVDRRVMLTNLSDFPDMRLIGYITGPTIQDYEIEMVKDNVPLSKGYKFNEYALFGISTDVLNRAGGIEHVDFKAIAAILDPAEIIDPSDTYISNENPLDADYYYYRISALSETEMTLTLVQRVLRYNDGSHDRVITY